MAKLEENKVFFPFAMRIQTQLFFFFLNKVTLEKEKKHATNYEES